MTWPPGPQSGTVRTIKCSQEYFSTIVSQVTSPLFIPVATTPEFPDGTLRKVMAGDTGILLARVNGQFYATGLLCPHLGADLSEGTLNGTILTCPMHNSQFDLRDGRVVRWTDLTGVVLNYAKRSNPPRPLPCYPVRIDEETVLVQIP